MRASCALPPTYHGASGKYEGWRTRCDGRRSRQQIAGRSSTRSPHRSQTRLDSATASGRRATVATTRPCSACDRDRERHPIRCPRHAVRHARMISRAVSTSTSFSGRGMSTAITRKAVRRTLEPRGTPRLAAAASFYEGFELRHVRGGERALRVCEQRFLADAERVCEQHVGVERRGARIGSGSQACRGRGARLAPRRHARSIVAACRSLSNG